MKQTLLQVLMENEEIKGKWEDLDPLSRIQVGEATQNGLRYAHHYIRVKYGEEYQNCSFEALPQEKQEECLKIGRWCAQSFSMGFESAVNSIRVDNTLLSSVFPDTEITISITPKQ